MTSMLYIPERHTITISMQPCALQICRLLRIISCSWWHCDSSAVQCYVVGKTNYGLHVIQLSLLDSSSDEWLTTLTINGCST